MYLFDLENDKVYFDNDDTKLNDYLIEAFKETEECDDKLMKMYVIKLLHEWIRSDSIDVVYFNETKDVVVTSSAKFRKRFEDISDFINVTEQKQVFNNVYYTEDYMPEKLSNNNYLPCVEETDIKDGFKKFVEDICKEYLYD